MARLNEPAPSIESIESLKRRFIRQNRDLARSNSTQGVKIRQQESEISHLLSENASLRQRILQLENELSVSSEDEVRQGVDALRQRLEAQLRDFTKQVNGSLDDLESLQKKPRRRKSRIATSPKRSPARKEWKNSSTLCEVLASQGQTMPTIVEDKHFPRRTLGPEEIERLEQEQALTLSESPELERPVTFLDRQNQAAEDWSAPSSHQSRPDTDADIIGSVEIRRKRRHSSLVSETQDQDTSVHPLKAGAKRKIAIPPSKPEQAPVRSPERRVLGEKSVNTNPTVSPRKASVAENKKPIPSKPAATSRKTTPVLAPPRVIEVPPQAVDIQPDDDDAINEVKPEPITPAGLAIFSPPSTQASDEPKGRPATPPPSISDTGSLGRGSRRSRPAVSYAEPKLNVKMRRPGKELADAVGTKRESQGSAEPESQHVVHLKREPSSARPIASEELDTNEPQSPSQGREKATSEGKSRESQPSEEAQTAEDIFEVTASPPQKLPVLPDPPKAARSTSVRRASNVAPTLTTSSATAPKRTTSAPDVGMSGSLRRARRQTLGGTANSEPATSTVPAARTIGAASGVNGSIQLRRSSSVSKLSSGNSDRIADGKGIVGAGPARTANVRAERAARIADRRRSMML